jgi:hypothetical protein
MLRPGNVPAAALAIRRFPSVLSRLAHIENGDSGLADGIPKFILRNLEPQVASDGEIAG